MSTEDTNSVRVINQEYERVLSNPDNIIVSEALQELIDMPLPVSEEVKDTTLIDSLSITCLVSDGLPVAARGDLVELSMTKESEYIVIVECSAVKKEFISSLCNNRDNESKSFIGLEGLYNFESNKCDIKGWSLKRSAPQTYQLQITFRSDDVIF